MNLKITNETANSFTESVGISDERVLELSAKLDNMMKKYLGEKLRVCHVMDEIAMMCNTEEELVFCVISHCNFVAIKYGLFYCLPKDFKEKGL